MEKVLPRALTSYDLLKAAAVIIMLADHIGLYFFPYRIGADFFPDHLWWRVIGRTGFPIWFFLIGFANTRTVPPRLWAGALVLLAGHFVAGMRIFPLNAIFTIILLRPTIDAVMRFSLGSKARFVISLLLIFTLALPTGSWLCEYGTVALITAMFGYAVRRRPLLGREGQGDNVSIIYGLLSLILFVLVQQATFGFGALQFIVMAFGSTLCIFTLYNFRPAEYPRLTAACPAPLRALIQFMGRYTLEIYVLHLLAFKAAGLYFQPERFKLFNWSWHRQLAFAS